MLSALLKKQLLETVSWLFVSKKGGKKRKKSTVIASVVLAGFLFVYFGIAMFFICKEICEPLCSLGFGWFYFLVTSIISIVAGVIGSIFTTYTSLYVAKDNDFLLSLPIPVSKILFSRMVNVYVVGAVFESVVMIPVLITWFIYYPNHTFLSVLFSILLPIVISFFILVLSCLLGWVVAYIGSRLKGKSYVIILLSFAGFAAYYYLYMQAADLLMKFFEIVGDIATYVEGNLKLLYYIGHAAEGDVVSLAVISFIVFSFFALLYFVLSKTFIKIITTNKGEERKVYKSKQMKTSTVQWTLIKKEFKRFFKSIAYVMNCGIGIVMTFALGVYILISVGDVVSLFETFFGENDGLFSLIAVAMIFLISSMNYISAPSVSLEGKNIWILQSLPVSPWQILKAKLYAHLILVVPVSFFLVLSILIALAPTLEYIILVSVASSLFLVFVDVLGLSLNLLYPNLHWTNETVPIKQSLSVTVTLLGGWGLIFALGGIYYLLIDFVSPLLYLIFVSVLFMIADVFLWFWLKNKGTELFSKL